MHICLARAAHLFLHVREQLHQLISSCPPAALVHGFCSMPACLRLKHNIRVSYAYPNRRTRHGQHQKQHRAAAGPPAAAETPAAAAPMPTASPAAQQPPGNGYCCKPYHQTQSTSLQVSSPAKAPRSGPLSLLTLPTWAQASPAAFWVYPMNGQTSRS